MAYVKVFCAVQLMIKEVGVDGGCACTESDNTGGGLDT